MTPRRDRNGYLNEFTVANQSPMPGVLVAALVGALFGLPNGFLTVTLSLSQHVSGLGITLFATSLASLCLSCRFSEGREPAYGDAVRHDGLAADPDTERPDAADAIATLVLVARRAAYRQALMK